MPRARRTFRNGRATHSGPRGLKMHAQPVMDPDTSHQLRHTIAEAMHVPSRPPSARPSRCPLCGQQVQQLQHHGPDGTCLARKACERRRAELDDETIEWLGLLSSVSTGSPQETRRGPLTPEEPHGDHEQPPGRPGPSERR